jgi:hypothetical protein
MTRSEAQGYIERSACAFTDPALTPEQLQDLVEMARKPGEEDGSSAYSTKARCARAVARGWRLKAGNASDRFTFMVDGQQFTRSQVQANCQSQAEYWEKAAGQARRRYASGKITNPDTSYLGGS